MFTTYDKRFAGVVCCCECLVQSDFHVALITCRHTYQCIVLHGTHIKELIYKASDISTVITVVAACPSGVIAGTAMIRTGIDDARVDLFTGLAGPIARLDDDLLVGGGRPGV